MSIKPLMRYHGAKWRLAPWIITHFPQHNCYVEPFGGSAAVLISKEPSAREVYNDKNDEMVNLFNVIRCDVMRPQLLRLLTMTPYSRTEFEWAKEPSSHNRNGHGEIKAGTPAIMEAHKLLVRAQMGFGSAGATRGNTGFRLDTARTGTSLQALWSELPEVVLAVTERLRNVIIENADAYHIIGQHDRSDTLFYLDPPYTFDTRTNKDSYGKFEMSESEHARLLELTQKSKGMFVISGYDNDLYNDMLAGWTKSLRQTAISSRNGSTKRTEVLWISPNCEKQQPDIFGDIS